MEKELSFYKETFDKISEEKKNRIFEVAIEEFAQLGYGVANINVIAKKVGISVGSIYSYFHSKEALFLATVERGMIILDRALDETQHTDGTFAETIRQIFDRTVSYAKKYPYLCQLYLNISTEELAPLAQQLSEKMESRSFQVYMEILKRARLRREISSDVQVEAIAYYIDNLVIMLQLSYSSTYYKARLKKYLGKDAMDDDEKICSNLCALVERSVR